MENARIFCHDGIQYLAAWDSERFELYGNNVFDCLQSVRNLYSDIQMVLPTPSGDLIVIASKEVVYYSLITTRRRDRLWQKCASETIDYQVRNAIYCSKAGVLVLLTSHQIVGLGVELKLEDGIVCGVQLSMNWVVKIKQDLFEMSITIDERYIALWAEGGKVLIWDLEKLPELIHKTATLEQFVESNQVVGCDQPIIRVEFRQQDNLKTPNSLYILTSKFMRVYQEVKLDDLQSSFVQLLEVELNNGRALLQVERLNASFRFNGEDEPREDSRKESVDTVCIHCGTEFCVYELYGLRSARANGSYKLVKRLNLKGIDQLLQITHKSGDKHLSMVGRRQSNLCRLLYMYFEDQVLECKYLGWAQPLQGILADEESSKIILKGAEGRLYTLPRHEGWLKVRDGMEQEPSEIGLNTKEKVALYKNCIYWVTNSKLNVLNLSSNSVSSEIAFHKPSLREIFALCSNEAGVYLLCDGQVVRVSSGTATVIKSLVPFNRVLKLEYNSLNQTLLVKNPKWYILYRLKMSLAGQSFEVQEIRKSPRHLIYGGGYWAELYESEVVFGTGSNRVVSFSIGQFLGAISKQHDVKVLFYRIYHVSDDVFQLQIQNYVFFLHVEFDTKKQKHTVTAVRRNKHTVELLMARVGRLAKPDSLEVVLADRDLTVRTDNRIIYFGKYMGEVTNRPELLTASNPLNFSMMRNPVPMHHPKFLNQLLQLANFSQVETILWAVHSQIAKKGSVDEEFRLELGDFLQIFNKDKYPELAIVKRYSEVVDFEQTGRTTELKELSTLILQDTGRTGLHKNNPLMLSSIVDFCVYRQENARSLDYFSSIFISQTRHLWMNKTQCLSTKELCWIMHSNNKEEAFQLLIEQPLRQKQDQLSWSLLTKYAAVLWYQNIQHIRKWLERIALAEYKRAQDPFDCLLWYVLLGKKNIVVALFKKAMDQIKTYEFLQRDFSQQQHRTAASKNAYALLSKKRYEHAIAFFILATSFQDALSICLNQLKDIQLAILICKLFDTEMGRQPLQNLYRQNFLKTGEITGDIWIRHCGYYLLGEHVTSYNCLYEECYDDTKVSNEASKISCETWRQEFQPQLSVFHPSVMILADRIKDSFKIKRELQEHEQSRRRRSNNQDIFESGNDATQPTEQEVPQQEKFLQSNERLHLQKSVNYYLMINIPYLALTLMMQHQKFLQEEPQLFQLVCQKYVNQLFASSVTHLKLDSSLRRIGDLKKLTEGIHNEDFYESFTRKLVLVDCGELLLSWYLKLGKISLAQEYLQKYVGQVRQLLMEEFTPFKVETKAWYLTTMHFIYWLQENLKLLGTDLRSSQPKINRLYGQLFICLQLCRTLLLLRLESIKGLNESLKLLVIACDRINKNEALLVEEDALHLTVQDLEELQTLMPDRRHRLQTSKTSKRMDILEESFRRQVEEEKEQSHPIDEQYCTKLVFHFVTLGSLTQRTTIEPWVREILLQSQEHVKCRIDALMEEEKFEEILSELRDFLKNGAFFWGKTKYLNLNQTTDRQDLFERLTLIQSERFIGNRLQSSLGRQLRDGRRTSKEVLEAKEIIFRNGIEIFKNRTELARFFVVNSYQNPQYGEAVVLFKKSIKKIDLYAAVATRNRSQDGSTLLDEDVVYTVPNDNGQKLQVRSQVLAQCLSFLNNQIDRKAELVHSYRKLELHASQYLRQQEQKTYTDFNELNSVVAHRHLPVFMIGAKASIDVLSFSNMKSLAKMQCNGMGELTRLKMDSAGDFIGCCDSDGNFSSYRFDSSYSAAPNFLLRKTNISEFAYLNSNIIATASNKDSLLQVYDPLISPAKSCVYKDRVSNAIGIEYVPESRKLLVIKKADVSIFDVRRGFLNRFDTTSMTAGDNRCSSLTTSSHRVVLGGTQGELRIFNLEGQELLCLKPFKSSKRPPAVQEIRISRSNIFALSGDGALSYCYSMD